MTAPALPPDPEVPPMTLTVPELLIIFEASLNLALQDMLDALPTPQNQYITARYSEAKSRVRRAQASGQALRLSEECSQLLRESLEKVLAGGSASPDGTGLPLDCFRLALAHVDAVLAGPPLGAVRA